VQRFGFDFAPLYRAVALPLGISPRTCWVEVGDSRLRARFGFWLVRTELANIEGTEVTGPYRTAKTIGPAHLSVADRGLTFATNADRGLCLRFRQPVAGLEPFGRLRHPALTVTVTDVDGLAAAVSGSTDVAKHPE
jgi:hypothetical protein